MNIIRLISLLLLLGTDISRAEPATYPVSSPLAREFVSQNGLVQNIVTGMTEDQFGRFWVGTQDGVNVIDSNNVKLISSVGSKTPLSGKVVISLQADRNETVWVATTQGLNKVNSRDFSVQVLFHRKKALLGIRQMLLLDNDHLAIVVQRDLLVLNLSTEQFTEPPMFAGQVEGLGPSSNGILIKTTTGMLQYSIGKKPIVLAVPPAQLAGSEHYLQTDQTLWLITADKSVISCQKGECQPLQLPPFADEAIQHLHMTLHQNALYFLRNDEVIVYSLKDQSFRLIKPQLPIQNYTSSGANAGIRVLSSGDIVTGRRQGLLIIPDTYHPLHSYPQFSSVTGNKIYALTAVSSHNSSSEELLIATQDKLQLYQFNTDVPRLVQQIPYPKPLTPALFVKLNDELLLSSLQDGVFTVDLHKKEITPWRAQIPELPALGPLIDTIKLDNQRNLLLFHQHLVMVRQTTSGYVQLWSATLPTLKTAKMIYHNHHLIIAAYQQGLLSSIWQDWSQPPTSWQTSAAGNPILDIRATTDRQVQLMTAENGVELLHIPPEGPIRSEELAATKGLPNTTAVCSVGLSADVWVAASHDGLALYDKTNKLIRHLTWYDGLVQKEFNQYQCGRLDDKAYFAGENGLSLIGHATTSAHKAHLQLSHVLVDGQKIDLVQQPIAFTEPNTISLHYSFAPYPVLAPVRFQSRLEPGNEEWFETTDTTLRYIHLSPGHYRLHLRAVQFDGSVSEPVKFDFQVKPLFWRSMVAYMLYSLSFAVVLWLYFRQRWQIQQARVKVAESQRQFQIEYTDKLEEAVRLRTDKLEQQQQEFLLLQQEKIEFLTTTSHDLKNLSALIQLNLADLNKYLLPTGQDSWHNVHSSCRLLNTLVDNILELSKLNAGVITPNLQPVNLPDLLQKVYQPFKLMAEKRQIDLQLHINEELIVLTDPHLLARLLMNLLDNALKNLSSGHAVQVELKKRYRTSRQVYLLVRDSGPGLPEDMRRHWGQAFQRGDASYQGSGLGLSIVRKIAELLVLPVSLYSSDRGTCFELRLQQTQLQESNSASVAGQAAIIESDPQSRQFLYYELVRRGFQVAVFNNTKDFARSGQRGFSVLISDIHFNATDDTIANLALLKSSLEPNGKLIFVSADATVRQRLPEETQLYFMLKPVKRSRLAWLLTKET